jgi:hypothetical protein
MPALTGCWGKGWRRRDAPGAGCEYWAAGGEGCVGAGWGPKAVFHCEKMPEGSQTGVVCCSLLGTRSREYGCWYAEFETWLKFCAG